MTGEKRPAARSRAGDRGGARRRARALVLQGLYQWQLAGTAPTTIYSQLAESDAFARCDARFFEALWHGVTGEFEALTSAFAPYLDRKPSALSPIEKAVLAIGAWELMREPGTPYRVAINEAVELAKSYGGTDGHKYVNGVLDRLALAVRSPEVAASRKAS